MEDTNIDELRKTSTCFEKFGDLDVARTYSKENGMLPVFARDAGYKNNLAAKDFVVAGYDEFWKRFKRMKPENRCFYEIIAEGLPCKIHIDSEVEMEHNPGFDPEKTEKGFFAHIDRLLKDLKMIEEDETYETLTLKSSNSKKYSKHFFIDIKGKKFANNYHVGAFMRRLRDRIIAEEGEESVNPYFFAAELASKGKVFRFFADMAIYTKNRNFRTYGSSKKLGGYRPLLLLEEDSTYLSEHPENIEESAFFDTIIQYIDPEKRPERLLRCLELDETEPSSRIKDVQGGECVKRKNVPSALIPKTAKISKTSELPFIHKIESEINREWGSDQQLYLNSYDKRFKTISFDSRSSQCRMKIEGTGDKTALHKNHINFKVYLKKGTFVQGCFTDNDTCTVKITASDGSVKVMKKHTIDYKLSPSLRSEISQYFTMIEEGEELALAKTIIKMYQRELVLSREDKILP